MPSLEYLARLGEDGVDWFWILTGEPSPDSHADASEAELIESWRQLDEPFHTALMVMIRAARSAGPVTSASSGDRPTLHDRRREYHDDDEGR